MITLQTSFKPILLMGGGGVKTSSGGDCEQLGEKLSRPRIRPQLWFSVTCRVVSVPENAWLTTYFTVYLCFKQAKTYCTSLNTNVYFCLNAGVYPYFTGCVPSGAGLEGIQEAPRSQPQREERNARLRTYIEFKNIMNPYLIPISLISSCLSVVSIGEFSPLLKQII